MAQNSTCKDLSRNDLSPGHHAKATYTLTSKHAGSRSH
ncbi:acetyltransferase [Lacticaseibacillus zeae]|uniref:Acetyltransferase n=1 Tax=Lacticaseibacillus zeae TaxID=57037 RepID=A0A5R8M2R9_LACZE|nr:acetyltransferase [Lacticaseibacillus zeae]